MSKLKGAPADAARGDDLAMREEADAERTSQTQRDANAVRVRAERVHRVVPTDPETHKNPGDEYEISRQEAAQLHASGLISFAAEDDERAHHEEVGRRHVEGYRSRRIATGSV